MKSREVSFRLRIPQLELTTRSFKSWLPSRGSVVFTLAMVAGLLWAQSAGALSALSPNYQATSTSTIAYQGRLADSAGAPLTGTYPMVFRVYDAASGGAPIWQESRAGSNSVVVNDGLFNVMLGSVTPIPAEVFSTHNVLWLGVSVSADSEMTPRVQLGSVPFAVQALSVPDGSVTTAKLADRSVTSSKLAEDFFIPFVPRVLEFVSKQNDLLFNADPSGATRIVDNIDFSLPSPPAGYRWDLEWRFNQRYGSMYELSLLTSFLLDGAPIKDSGGVPFAENSSLSMQGSPTDNMIFGGTVYQNNVVPGNHRLTWQMVAWGSATDQFLVRQRWLVLTAIIVPDSF